MTHSSKRRGVRFVIKMAALAMLILTMALAEAALFGEMSVWAALVLLPACGVLTARLLGVCFAAPRRASQRRSSRPMPPGSRVRVVASAARKNASERAPKRAA